MLIYNHHCKFPRSCKHRLRLFLVRKRKMAAMCISRIILLMIVAIESSLAMAANNLEIGVCYGMLGDNLPPPADVVALYKQYGISKMRLYDPNPDALQALRGSNIEVALGVRNQDIQDIASSQNAADSWFSTNMKPYINDVRFILIVVGNEVVPGDYARYVAPAMQKLLSVLGQNNLQDIRVTTAVSSGVLRNSYPPSACEFEAEARGPLVDILNVLSGQRQPVLMANLYPYFAYAAEPEHISIEYAQFTAKDAVVHDSNLAYYNLFSAMVDAFYWAMEKVGAPGVGIAASESGWPSAGNGNFTTPELASTYNKNFIKNIVERVGTPKRPNTYIEAFIFAMFNENLKAAGVEQNWGLFYPNKEPVYSVFSSD